MSIEAMKHVIEDLVSAMKYHIEQTRPIHRTIIAIEDAEELLKAIAEAEKQEPYGWAFEDGSWYKTQQFRLSGGAYEGQVAVYTHPQPKEEPVIKEVVVNADYREMWAEQVRLNQQLCIKGQQ